MAVKRRRKAPSYPNAVLGSSGQPPSSGGHGGGGHSTPTPSYPNAVIGSQESTPSSTVPQGTTVVTSHGHAPVVTRAAGTPIPPALQPTLSQFLNQDSAYLDSAEELRRRYLGTGNDAAATRVQQAATGLRQAEILNALATTDSGVKALTPQNRRYYTRITDPANVEEEAQNLVDRWWQRAKGVSGLSGAAPNVTFGDAPKGAGAVTSGPNRIRAGFDAAQVAPPFGWTPGTDEARQDARATLLHEFAHVGQQRAGEDPGTVSRAEHDLNEGRADRFAKLVSGKLGHPIDGAPPGQGDYADARRDSRRQDSRGDILRGQFQDSDQVSAERALRRALGKVPDMGNLQDVAPIIVRQALRTGVPASLLAATTEQESGFNPLATEESGGTISQSQAGGETQFIPSTAAQYGVQYGDSPQAIRSQFRGQADLLADQGAAKDPAAALASYYGSGTQEVAPGTTYPEAVLAKTAKYAPLDRAVKAAAQAGSAPSPGQPGGSSKPIPKETVSRFAAIVDEAKKIDSAQLPYVWGGGHVTGKIPGPSNISGYDCSGVVSRILQRAGYDTGGGGQVSGWYRNFGEPGPGAVTIYANDGHVFMKIGDRYFGTSHSNAGGGAGFIPTSYEQGEAQSGNYTVRHVPGLGRDIARRMGIRVDPTSSATSTGGSSPGIQLSANGTQATVTDSAVVDKPGISSKPIAGPQATFSAPIANPLAATPALPQSYLGAGSQDSSESSLTALLGGSQNSSDSELSAMLERFRPQRRLR